MLTLSPYRKILNLLYLGDKIPKVSIKWVAESRYFNGVFNKLVLQDQKFSVWRSTQISRQTTLRIFKACVKSILAYDYETGLASMGTTRGIRVFFSFIKAFENRLKRRKWRWLGHTLKKGATNITRTALKWNPQGSSKLGYSSNTWGRLVKNELDPYGFTVNEAAAEAGNRIRWRNHDEALCSIEE